MAPKRKMISETTKHYSKAEKESRKQAEKSLHELIPIQSEPPEWLDEVAQEEYHRIYPLLSELPIASLDLALVSTYCQAYSDYVDANLKLQTQDVVIETRNGTRLNPLHTVKRDSFNIINSIAPKLGLTIDSRMKIMETKNTEEKDIDPMSDLL